MQIFDILYIFNIYLWNALNTAHYDVYISPSSRLYFIFSSSKKDQQHFLHFYSCIRETRSFPEETEWKKTTIVYKKSQINEPKI